MSRSIAGKQFTVCYKTEVTSIIRGHHVYKEAWDATIGEMLGAASDDREEAKEYDNGIRYAIGLYKKSLRWTYANRNFKFMFPFYQSRSREQYKSIDNWKTSVGNWTCRSRKVNFHNKQ